MVVRTQTYPFEIALPEVIESAESAPIEYLGLLDEALDDMKKTSSRRVFDVDFEIHADFVLSCPVCLFESVHVPAIVLATPFGCVIATEKDTRIIRSEDLSKRIRKNGWRLVIFCRCGRGHTTKIIYQFSKGRIYLLYYEMDKRKFREITKFAHSDDVDRK
jgi:hypothetical protein